MSSACVCHLNEWCFYCEMYLPLEKVKDHYKYRADKAETLLENIMHGSNPVGWWDEWMPKIAPKLKPEPPVCSWDWMKMSEEDRAGKYVCRCWNNCPELQRKKKERIANARGFWGKLFAKMF